LKNDSASNTRWRMQDEQCGGQAASTRDISPMDLECTPLPTDAEIKEMFDSTKQHLVHEKEDELVRKLETVESQHHQNKLARGTH